MKKTFKKHFIILAIAVAGTNMIFISTYKKGGNFTVENLVALQSSAGEAYCDQTHQNSCTMQVGNVTGYSTGNGVIIH